MHSGRVDQWGLFVLVVCDWDLTIYQTSTFCQYFGVSSVPVLRNWSSMLVYRNWVGGQVMEVNGRSSQAEDGARDARLRPGVEAYSSAVLHASLPIASRWKAQEGYHQPSTGCRQARKGTTAFNGCGHWQGASRHNRTDTFSGKYSRRPGFCGTKALTFLRKHRSHLNPKIKIPALKGLLLNFGETRLQNPEEDEYLLENPTHEPLQPTASCSRLWPPATAFCDFQQIGTNGMPDHGMSNSRHHERQNARQLVYPRFSILGEGWKVASGGSADFRYSFFFWVKAHANSGLETLFCILGPGGQDARRFFDQRGAKDDGRWDLRNCAKVCSLFLFLCRYIVRFKKKQNDIALSPGLRHLRAGSEYPCGLVSLTKTKTQTA